ncbi:LacI family DNA-binding transcriptional regulator [Pelagovum pacificum]|uniref:LacI family transcriptional regulator n=1 Tax=Pelagovum pacificum TaxID=2588711 RepID=A0A5C5GE52_9RHOB|nr:LacI family DNA-binding transcriptional regulator [Pelagovum pacificum]QQA43818.1 LacI family DNA-binding transcriptional regulator [Pelagovum pacificum]TNY33052.1 LacI family transcriptional regulator [Pelagovum pacificum]
MTVAAERTRLSDVAQRAGVSLATASKALNGTGRMTTETRQRVQHAASELGFRPNTHARALIAQRSFTVGLLTNDSYGRFSMPVMSGVSEALVSKGVSVFMCGVENDPELGRIHLDAMLDKQVDGIIATGKRGDRQLPAELAELPIPVVYAFSKGPDDAVTLMPDDAQGAREATEWLRRSGRRRLAHVTGPEGFAAAEVRAAAFREIAGPDAPVLFGDWSEAWGHEAAARLWDGGNGPDGIFCGNDQIARGIIDALRERGVDVPGAVGVIGFDNWGVVVRATRPPMTSVDMNLAELGRQAGRLILALSSGEDVAPGIRHLPCSLVVRESCGGAGPDRMTA